MAKKSKPQPVEVGQSTRSALLAAWRVYEPGRKAPRPVPAGQPVQPSLF